MKIILLGLLAIGSISAFAEGLPLNDSKVICGNGERFYATSAVEELNIEIQKAKVDGYSQISAPAITNGVDDRHRATACVTVSK